MSHCGVWFGFVYFLALPHRTWALSSPSRGRAVCIGSPVAAWGPGAPLAAVPVGCFLRGEESLLVPVAASVPVLESYLSVCLAHCDLADHLVAVSFLKAVWSVSLRMRSCFIPACSWHTGLRLRVALGSSGARLLRPSRCGWRPTLFSLLCSRLQPGSGGLVFQVR